MLFRLIITEERDKINFVGNFRCHALCLRRATVLVEILRSKTLASKFPRLYYNKCLPKFQQVSHN